MVYVGERDHRPETAWKAALRRRPPPRRSGGPGGDGAGGAGPLFQPGRPGAAPEGDLGPGAGRGAQKGSGGGGRPADDPHRLLLGRMARLHPGGRISRPRPKADPRRVPPFEERYAPAVHLTRMSRLGAEERREASSILRLLVGPGNAGAEESKGALRRLGAILSKADSYDPILSESADVDIQVEAFQAVWREAAELRKSGRLLVLGRRIDCPVVAIHGEYDPHPSDGVRLPSHPF